MRRSLIALALVAAVSTSGCGASTQTPLASVSPTLAASGALGVAGSQAPLTASVDPAPSPSLGPSPAATLSPTGSPVPDTTVWLCKPGLANDPCAGNLDTTSVDAAGKQMVVPQAPAADPPVDCFYVYPTVSRQKTANATLAIDPEERAVAVAQAARFSSVCRVYAPMYKQLTLAAIADPSKVSATSALAAYDSIHASFMNYMENYNHGRPVVFIGHSQGAIMLTLLLKAEVDPRPEWRKLLVSALIVGGNFAVPAGKLVGGDFANIPACRSTTDTGCVVAYSSFASQPPANSMFGRADSPLSLLAHPFGGSLQVLCVNPAAPGGGSGALDPYYPTNGLSLLTSKSLPAFSVATPWVSFPGQYSAHCETANGATWLQVDPAGGSGDKRLSVLAYGSPTWGLHVVDVNVALGNLVDLVRAEAAAYHG